MVTRGFKGQIQPRLEANTGGSRGIHNIPIRGHKLSNIRLLRVVWCVLQGAVEQGWLGRLSSW